MQISKRLKTVADMITRGNVLADIGTDHGYVPIYLVKEGKVPGALAMDIGKGPLEKAIANIKKEGLSEYIETRLSDGLDKLNVGEADSILIAGMGGELMIKILSAAPEKCLAAKELILSPHSQINLVRKYLKKELYGIEKETMVKDEGKYYTILKVLPKGKAAKQDSLDDYTEAELRYGRRLIEEKSPVFLEYLEKEKAGYERIKKMLEDAPGTQVKDRLSEVKKELEWIESIR